MAKKRILLYIRVKKVAPEFSDFRKTTTVNGVIV